MWRDDDELFALMRGKLFPAVVGDILDTMGFLHQFLSPQIRPLRSDMVVVGRAMPVLESNCFSNTEPAGHSELSRKPFGLLLLNCIRSIFVRFRGSAPIILLFSHSKWYRWFSECRQDI